eukprot:7716373-Ditylum_brightwellii.AAC.1
MLGIKLLVAYGFEDPIGTGKDNSKTLAHFYQCLDYITMLQYTAYNAGFSRPIPHLRLCPVMPQDDRKCYDGTLWSMPST